MNLNLIDFQLPDLSKIFEIFYVENFFEINSKLLYILNLDEKPADMDHPITAHGCHRDHPLSL